MCPSVGDDNSRTHCAIALGLSCIAAVTAIASKNVVLILSGGVQSHQCQSTDHVRGESGQVLPEAQRRNSGCHETFGNSETPPHRALRKRIVRIVFVCKAQQMSSMADIPGLAVNGQWHHRSRHRSHACICSDLSSYSKVRNPSACTYMYPEMSSA